MGVISQLFERRSSLARPGTWLYEWITGGGETASGQKVSEERAMTLPSVYACINVISTDIATSPLHLYRRVKQGKERALNHPLYNLLNKQPNPEHDSTQFRLIMQGHLLGWGNAYAEIILDKNSGRVMELWPLHPSRMSVEREGGVKIYKYVTSSGQQRIYRQNEIFHLMGLGGDGLVGYSPIRMARESIGVALAAQEYAARFYKNDARPSVVLKHQGTLGEDAYKRLKKTWEQAYSGSSNAFKTAILEEGMDVSTISIDPEDAEFIATRKFQVIEVCRIFRVPPHKIMDLERATYSNITEQSTEYVKDTIRPWCRIWEMAILTQLIPPEEQGEYFAEFLLDDLMRGDILTRYQAYSMGRQGGWLSVNEIRAKENENAIEHGNSYLVPMNMNVVEASGNRGLGVPAIRNRRDAREFALERLRLSKSFQRLFKGAAERLVKREARDIRKAAKEMLSGTPDFEKFQAWIAKYYGDYVNWFEEFLGPVFESYAEAIQASAAKEVGAPVGMTPGLTECLDTHVEASARYNMEMSREAAKKLVSDALKEGKDVLPVLEKYTEEIVQKRPAKIAAWEATRTSGLMTKATYFYSGVQEFAWCTLDENPFCKLLDGKTLEMGSSCRGNYFLGLGDVLTARSEEFKPAWNVSTPPLWLGCSCQIVAVS